MLMLSKHFKKSLRNILQLATSQKWSNSILNSRFPPIPLKANNPKPLLAKTNNLPNHKLHTNRAEAALAQTRQEIDHRSRMPL